MANFPKYLSLLSNIKKPILALVGALIVALASAWMLHEFGPKDKELPPTLEVEFRRHVGDYQTELLAWAGNQGIMSTYWEVTVSNHGKSPDSILEHQVRMYPTNKEGEIFYSGLDQGIYSMNLLPLEFPLSIEPGHAVRFLAKIGIIIEPKVYQLILGKFSIGYIQSAEGIHRYLYRNGTDVFGLPVAKEAEGAFAFPKSDEAPSISIELKTIKNEKLKTRASWYPDAADFL